MLFEKSTVLVSVAKITQKKEPILLDSFKVITRLTSDIARQLQPDKLELTELFRARDAS